MVNILRNIREFIKSIKISTRCFKKGTVHKQEIHLEVKNIITTVEHSFGDNVKDFFSE